MVVGGGDVVDGGGGGSRVDGVEDVERAVDEGSRGVEIVVLLHRNPSAHFFFLKFRWFGKLVRRWLGINGYPDLS